MVRGACVCLLLFVALCMTSILPAQVPLVQWYTVDDGLPGSQVYQVLQDRNGFIWCSTGSGVARFDGKNFVTFSTADGFPDRGAYHLVEDSRGRIWFMTFSGKACYYERGRFFSPDVPMVKNDFVRWLVEMPDGRLLFLTNKGYVIMQSPGGYTRNYYVGPSPLFHGQLLGSDTLIIGSDRYFSLQLSTGIVAEINIPVQPKRRFLRVLPFTKRKLLLTTDLGFYQFSEKGLQDIIIDGEIMAEQVCTMDDKNGDLWVGTYSGAIRFAGGQIDREHMYWTLKGHGITSIIRDHEGNLWFSVFNEGICMLPKQFTSVYNRENGLLADRNLLRIVVGKDNGVYAFTGTGDMFRIDSTQAVHAGRLPMPLPTVEVVLAWNAYPEIILGSGNLIFRLNDGVISHDDEMSRFFIGKFFAFSRPGYWIFPDQRDQLLEINEYNEQTQKYKTVWSAQNDRVPTISCMNLFAGGEGSYWLGTRNGAVYLDATQKLWFVSDDIPELRTMITNLARDVSGKTWIGTANEGVFCFDGKKLIAHYNIKNGLPGNSCNSFYPDQVEGMWACTNGGLAWIRPGNTTPVNVFRSPEMLPGQEALSMCKVDRRVYVATTKGVGSFLDNAGQLPAVFPPVYISSVKVDGQNKNVFDSCKMEPGQDNLELNFTAIEYRKGGAMRYRYQLEGADTGWSYTSTSHIQYRSLQPGKYIFRVYALNAAGLSSKFPAVLAFTIPPAWWQTWWFRFGAGIFLLGVIFSMIFLRARAVRKVADVRRQWLETRLQSLRAQINPHFVFNALNSVQSFVFSKQPEQANEYLVNFARMMRMISEGAEKETILLREEIAFLDYYILMEKLRFEDDFEYNIITDPEVDVNSFRIPPMIIQPFIENAFKHGLAQKEGRKILQVQFSGEANRLFVRIEDNGTGRKERPVEKEMEKSALGIANVIQRLVLLQRKSKRTSPVTITDLYTDDGQPAGVRIDLVIALPEKLITSKIE